MSSALEPRSAAEAEAQLAAALERSLADAPPAERLVVDSRAVNQALTGPERRAVEAGLPSGSSAPALAVAAKAAAKAAAKGLAARPPKVYPAKWYVIWSVPAGSESFLGLNHCKWPQLPIPNGKLAGSGWRVQCAKSLDEGIEIWAKHREEAPPIHRY